MSSDASVEQLVQLMGGRIWAESERSQGSTFRFATRFGLGTPQARSNRQEDLFDDLPVLVLDDNTTNRRILDQMLAEIDRVLEAEAS